MFTSSPPDLTFSGDREEELSQGDQEEEEEESDPIARMGGDPATISIPNSTVVGSTPVVSALESGGLTQDGMLTMMKTMMEGFTVPLRDLVQAQVGRIELPTTDPRLPHRR